MGTRTTYDRRIEQLESAVTARGRRVAARRPGSRAQRAIDAAVDDLLASPHAEAGDLIRIRAIQEIDFHVRHIDRLLPALAPEQLRRADTGSLHALEVVLAALVAATAPGSSASTAHSSASWTAPNGRSCATAAARSRSTRGCAGSPCTCSRSRRPPGCS
jgi:hypothetical protein